MYMEKRHSQQRIGFVPPHLAHFDDQIPEVVRRRDGQIEVEASTQDGHRSQVLCVPYVSGQKNKCLGLFRSLRINIFRSALPNFIPP